MATKHKRRTHSAARPVRTANEGDRRAWGARLLLLGIVAGAFGPSVTMLPLGGLSPFGPQKSFVLYASAALVLTGLALDTESRARALAVLRDSRLAWAAAAMTGLAVLSALTALDRWQALLGGFPDYRGLVSVLAYSVIGLGCLAAWRSAAGSRFLVRSSVIAGSVVSSVAALQYAGVFPGGPTGSASWRIASTLGNGSNLGVFEVLILPLVVLTALKDESRGWRAAGSVVGAASFALLLATQSRGAWLGVLTSCAVVVAVLVSMPRSRRTLNRRAALSGAAGMAVLATAGVVSPQLVRRAQTLLDSGSRTARWRLSAWDSAVDMVLSRPFLGYGPDNFRYGYPRFQAPGQVDGRWGYQVVEAAHNLVLDTAAAFGVVGVAILMAIVIVAARALVTSARDDQGEQPALRAALAAALAGGFIALQFHYVTMDTGTLLAALLAAVAAVELPQESRPGPGAPPFLVPALGTAAVFFALLTAASGAVVVADSMVGRGIAAAQSGMPWQQVQPVLENAAALASWEPQMLRAQGTAATAVLVRRFDPEAARDGLTAMTAVTAARPFDVVLSSEKANLTLAAGLAAKDKALLERAVAEFSEVERLDPNTGIATAGKATALLALGRVGESVASFERALRLSPRYKLGWLNAARAYERAGRDADAEEARRQARRF